MRKTKMKLIILFFAIVSLLTACSSPSKREIDPTSLYELERLQAEPLKGAYVGGDDFSHIRAKALEDTALSISAQGSLAWASKDINNRLMRDRWYLETIYNFNGMMLSHGVIPPVLVQGDNSLNLADPNTIRVADKTYKIVQQARFATTPPNWREYLWMSLY